MMQNFIDLSTFTDPLRTSNFPQNWTIYYWAYWMVWCVAAPFFIGSISRGRTVRQTILGGYVFGVGSTLTSFIVLGNYSMGLQMTDKADFIAKYLENGDMYGMIVDMIKTKITDKGLLKWIKLINLDEKAEVVHEEELYRHIGKTIPFAS